MDPKYTINKHVTEDGTETFWVADYNGSIVSKNFDNFKDVLNAFEELENADG